jgi:hypothetical protein
VRPVARRAALLALCLAECTPLDDPSPAALSGVLSLALSPQRLSADGASFVTLTGTLRSDTRDTATVTFTVSGARFADGTGQWKTLASGTTASAVAVVGLQAGDFLVTASVRQLVVTDTLHLVPALPTELDLHADRSAAPPDGNNQVMLTATLRRPPGQGRPSLGRLVDFSFADSTTGAPRPDLAGVAASDTSGVAHYNVASTLPATLKIWAIARDTTDVKASAYITFLKP